MAIPGKAVDDFIRSNAAGFKGRIIVDATNTFGQPELHNVSLLQGGLPQSKVYRAFSTLAWETYADPLFGNERADLFYCGDKGESHIVM